MPRDKREVESGLTGKGFEQRGTDHNYFIYRALDGKKSLAKTKTSFGKGFDINDNLLGQMARQCGLTKKLFLDLIDCPLGRAEYEKYLKSCGKL